jgi:hypothetical protein
MNRAFGVEYLVERFQVALLQRLKGRTHHGLIGFGLIRRPPLALARQHRKQQARKN